MRLALLSDLHANLQATQACLAHAQAAGAQAYAFLGDLVGYGGQPREVVDLVMDYASRGAAVVRGNHDAYAARNAQATAESSPARTEGERGADWTRHQLRDEHRAFLAELPLTARWETALLVHASADAPERWRYVDNPQVAAQSLDGAAAISVDIRHVFGGHVHEQTLYFRSPVGKLMPFLPTAGVPIPVPAHRQWVATVGSVGQPRDGRTKAMYALFDSERQQLIFQRVAYEHAAAAAHIRRAGLPEDYASRLERGR